MENKSIGLNIIGWLFGIVFLTIGVINMFWGNDPFFGVFIFLLSLIYFPPVNVLLKTITGVSIHPVIKILVVVFYFPGGVRCRRIVRQDRPDVEGFEELNAGTNF